MSSNSGFSSEHMPAYVCSHVFKAESPVMLVVHLDGDWQFLCGQEHPDETVPVVVGVAHLLKADGSLVELADLPEGWEAERTGIEQPWKRRTVEN
jgi:hypothetical protein